MYERGEIYKGRKPIHWCKRCHTALAEAEIEYSDENSDSIYVKFRFTEAVDGVLLGGAAGQRAHLDDDAVDAAGQRRPSRSPPTPTTWALSSASEVIVFAEALVESVAEVAGWEACGLVAGADGEPVRVKGRDLAGVHYAQPDPRRRATGVDHHGRARGALDRHRRGAHRARARRGGLPRRHEVRAADADAGRRQRRVRSGRRAVRGAVRRRRQPGHRRVAARAAARCWRPARSATATRTAGAASSR